jgi:hypothetical protein
MLNLPRRPLGNALDELKRLSALPSAAALGHVRLAGFKDFSALSAADPRTPQCATRRTGYQSQARWCPRIALDTQ